MTQTLDRATPESLGIPSSAILEWVDELGRIAPDFHSLMIVRHGRVAAEGWWAPNGPDLPHLLYSVSKSFTSTAVGLAISEGHFGLDDTVVSFFPDEAPEQVSPYLAAMKVRHLLSMATGHDEKTVDLPIPGHGEYLVRNFLAFPIADPPGSRFVYNTPASYMLSAIVQKATGLNLVDYLEPRLFEPLGIARPIWQSDGHGVAMGGFGLWLRTEDIARFGQLYLQGGVWGGRQVIPAEWVNTATTFKIDTGPNLNPNADWLQGYCYQFWRGQHDSFRGDGAFGQFCLVVPDQDLVLAMTAGIEPMHLVLESFWRIVLPRLAASPLAEDPAAREPLAARLAGLALVPHPGGASSPLEAEISGAEFALEANRFGFESLQLEFAPDGGSLTLGGGDGRPMRLDFGRGAWRAGRFELVPELLDRPIVASAVWLRPDRLELDICLYTDAPRFTMAFDFSGAGATVALSVTVAFGATDLGVLAARKVLGSSRGGRR
jgi:CubicO group peptidase (beta-lactamase class C family)